MAVLIIKNIEAESAGVIADYLDLKDIGFTVVDAAKEELPDHKKFDMVIILGGPMSVNDDDKYPYLKDEMDMIKERLKGDLLTLGICLGSQLIAKAAGANIKTCAEKEIGYYNIELTEEGMEDDMFENFEQLIPVFQWHGETFDLPKKAVLLATGKCKNQAFRIGNIIGLQFHTEVTEHMIKHWLTGYKEEVEKENIEAEFIESDALRMEKVYRDQMYRILGNILK